MKKILVFVQHMTDGGAERVLSELMDQWVRMGVSIRLVEIEPGMFDNSYPFSSEIEVVKLKEGEGRLDKHVRTISDMVRVMRENPDSTVLSFNKVVLYKLAFAMLMTKNRIVLSERNDPYRTPVKSRRWLRDWAFRRADACVFQTREAMAYFPESVQKKGSVIPNPINPALPEKYEGEREKKIVAAGRLDQQKNFPMLIDAFAIVHEEFPDYQLVIYGRGSQEEELKRQAEALGLKDAVALPGFSDNLYEEMRKCAVYVSSSDYEGISNSMLEALGMGVPSVVTDCPIGGARLVIRDGQNGILVPVGDKRKMADGILRVLRDRKYADSLSREAYKIREEYRIDKIAARWLELL